MTQRKKPTRILSAYNFRDHDPIIDEMRTMLKVYGTSIKQIAAASGISPRTIQNWFAGNVRSPRHEYVEAFRRALGVGIRYTTSIDTMADIRSGARIKWRGKVINLAAHRKAA